MIFPLFSLTALRQASSVSNPTKKTLFHLRGSPSIAPNSDSSIFKSSAWFSSRSQAQICFLDVGSCWLNDWLIDWLIDFLIFLIVPYNYLVFTAFKEYKKQWKKHDSRTDRPTNGDTVPLVLMRSRTKFKREIVQSIIQSFNWLIKNHTIGLSIYQPINQSTN